MFKNRTAQLIYYTIYLTLGLVAVVAGSGIFDDINNLRWDFYIHYTVLCNYFCIAVMIPEFISTVKKKENSYTNVWPAVKFGGVLSMLLTFLVFNILLAGAADRDPQANWRVGSMLSHIILPIMFIVDWFLFYERGKMKWHYAFSSTIFSFAYVAFIYIHAALRGFDTSILIPHTNTPLIYPYFFLNIETNGIGGVLLWMFGIFLYFAGFGFIFFGIDRLIVRVKARKKSI